MYEETLATCTLLVPVPYRPGHDILACRDHAGPTRRGLMAHTMPYALAMAEGWVERCRSFGPDVLDPAVVFALAIPDTLPGPPCCPSAGLARSTMMAAFRELTRGESS
jgi:hypothetical protein